MKHIISLGAGVQSSTMSLMAACGEITPMPDAAVFADTRAEPPDVYEWLIWLKRQLPFPVHIVSAGDLEKEATTVRKSAKGNFYIESHIPAFTLDGSGKKGMTPRQCTYNFKVTPIRRKIREMLSIKHGEKSVIVLEWIGISSDEITRMKISQDSWFEFRYPLIEKNMSRQDCLKWMEIKGFPRPPRSACFFCPFHSNAEWRKIKQNYPELFEKAVNMEKIYSKAKEIYEIKAFFHASRIPLDQVDLRTDVEKGQGTLWEIECEGRCGV